MANKRVENRKDFSYYMQLTDATTRQFIGHLADISTGGFKLDSDGPIPIGKEYRFRLALTAEVSDKPFMIFSAQSKWCKTDPIDPFVYNTGFHLLEMHPEDRSVFVRVLQLYGTKKARSSKRISPRSNRW